MMINFQDLLSIPSVWTSLLSSTYTCFYPQVHNDTCFLGNGVLFHVKAITVRYDDVDRAVLSAIQPSSYTQNHTHSQSNSHDHIVIIATGSTVLFVLLWWQNCTTVSPAQRQWNFHYNHRLVHWDVHWLESYFSWHDICDQLASVYRMCWILYKSDWSRLQARRGFQPPIYGR